VQLKKRKALNVCEMDFIIVFLYRPDLPLLLSCIDTELGACKIFQNFQCVSQMYFNVNHRFLLCSETLSYWLIFFNALKILNSC
jgi:hypothetical protein